MAAALRDRKKSSELVGAAVNRSGLFTLEGLRERTFTFWFSRLVYPQIWEDPVVDMAALELNDESRIITIGSGGCNALSYLAASPEHLTVVDLNAAHIALINLKLAAAQHLPDYQSFYRFFADADHGTNVEYYDIYIRDHLDPATLRYWERRNILGRRRIRQFSQNFYRYGLLGNFIGTCHRLSRMLGADPSKIVMGTTLEEQRRIFNETLAPLFDRKIVRWMVDHPASLYGLGIPPAQYYALAGDRGKLGEDTPSMSAILRARVERLACDFPLGENYFAWQAFNRGYAPDGEGPVPPYLQRENYENLRANLDQVDVAQISYTDRLAITDDTSLDGYVLLDAQDWMNDADLNHLWTEITRTARPGARVIFRTSATPTILPGRVSAEILSRWTYEEERSLRLGMQDRSAIYGGFHLYRFEG